MNDSIKMEHYVNHVQVNDVLNMIVQQEYVINVWMNSISIQNEHVTYSTKV